MKTKLGMLAIALPLGLAACATPQPQQLAAAPDPYVANAKGGVTYTGTVKAGRLPGTPAPATQEEFTTFGDTVLFAENDTSLSAEARAILTRQAEWLMRNTGFGATVEGHAQEVGTREYNLAVGARRASSVQEYLISKGVGADRLRTVSYGRERPASACLSEACLTQNRRAVTVVRPLASDAGV